MASQGLLGKSKGRDGWDCGRLLLFLLETTQSCCYPWSVLPLHLLRNEVRAGSPGMDSQNPVEPSVALQCWL